MSKRFLIRVLLTFIILSLSAQLLIPLSEMNLGQSPSWSDRAFAAETQSGSIFLPLVRSGSILPTIFGAQMKEINSQGGFDEMVRADSYWVRRNGILWSEVEEVKGVYEWDVLVDLEEELKNASSMGMEVILVIRSTPTWAQQEPGMYCGPIKEDELGSFANFMGEVVSRYSVSPYNVKYWEIWNEPDVDPVLRKNNPKTPFGCWGDNDDDYYGGGYFAEMLKKVYPAIKAADPEAEVVLGGLLLDCDPRLAGACDSSVHKEKPALFLEGILRREGGDYFDGVSFHAYDYYQGELGTYGGPSGWNTSWDTTGPVMSSKADFIREVLVEYEVSGKYLLNTESALIYDGNCDLNCETTKAYYLVQSFATALQEGLLGNVWYSVYGWRNSELLDQNGKPLPAYYAFEFARNEIRDAAFIQEISNYPDVKVLEFDRGDRRIWVLWSTIAEKQAITLPGTPVAAWDYLGIQVSASDEMEIDMTPLYLEWNP